MPESDNARYDAPETPRTPDEAGAPDDAVPASAGSGTPGNSGGARPLPNATPIFDGARRAPSPASGRRDTVPLGPNDLAMVSYEAPAPPPAQDYGSRSLPPAPGRRTWRSRIGDWLLGAAAMLLVGLLILGIAWFSLTRPAGSGPSAAPSAPTAPAGTATPPSDLAEGEVWLGDLDFQSGSLVAAGRELTDVTAVGQNVRSGEGGITVGYLELTGTVPFAVVAEELAPGSVVENAGGGEARIQTSVELLGRELAVTATGSVEVVNGRIVVEPTDLQIGTGPLSGLLGTLARGFVTIDYAIEGLPEGLVLQSVEVTDAGFRANLIGQDVLVAME